MQVIITQGHDRESPCPWPVSALYSEEGIYELEERKSVVHARKLPPRSIGRSSPSIIPLRFNMVSDADRFIATDEAFNPWIETKAR